ncbi:MAG: HPr family phosphocarrier protein [Oscillospiraceae bacterium]|nr:HPr family phosphocarrier protein [Oscillospiraceae bacterium]
MITKKRIYNITELQKLQALATKCKDDVTLMSEDGSVSVDAKSFIGLFALDFTKPVLVVTENAEYHQAIDRIGETLE